MVCVCRWLREHMSIAAYLRPEFVMFIGNIYKKIWNQLQIIHILQMLNVYNK